MQGDRISILPVIWLLKFSSAALKFFLKTISGLILNERLSLKDSDSLETGNYNQPPSIPLNFN